MIEYRKFGKEDSTAVHDLASKAWKYTYKNIFEPKFIDDFVNHNYSLKGLGDLSSKVDSGEMFFQLALDGSKVIGFCNIGYAGGRWELFRIYLDTSYIGKGVGKSLLKLGEAFLRSKKAAKYFLFVHKKNTIGINFYLRNGFSHIPEKDIEGELCMEKQTK